LNEWHHTRDEDLFQWRIFLFEWNYTSVIGRSEKKKVKEKKGSLSGVCVKA
jgi:hypothetical protein